jgi:hypothetical protein
MTQVGDSITLQIRGAPDTGTAVASGRTSFTVDPGASISVEGTIVEDHGDNWGGG